MEETSELDWKWIGLQKGSIVVSVFSWKMISIAKRWSSRPPCLSKFAGLSMESHVTPNPRCLASVHLLNSLSKGWRSWTGPPQSKSHTSPTNAAMHQKATVISIGCELPNTPICCARGCCCCRNCCCWTVAVVLILTLLLFPHARSSTVSRRTRTHCVHSAHCSSFHFNDFLFFSSFFWERAGWDAAERKRSCEVVALHRDFCRSPANRRDLVLCRGIAPMGPSLGGLPSNTTDCGSPELHNALTRVTSTASCTPPKHGRSWARTSSQIVTTCQMPSSWARSYSTGWEAVCGGCDSHAG